MPSYTGYAHLDSSTGYVATSELLGTGPQLIATVTGVDLKSTGQTTLYTVPSGKTAYITDIIVVLTTANTVAVAPTLRIGKASAYTEWLPATALTGLTATPMFISLAMTAALLVHQSFAATEVAKVDVTVGATATSCTASFLVIGFLV